MSHIAPSDPVEGFGYQPQPAPVANDELGQDAFLELMVAQMQNQDPFKPVESGEFFNQISQFSMVAGIQDMQYSMNVLAASLLSDQGLEAAGLVGHEVLVPSDEIDLQEGQVVKGAVDVPYPVEELNVNIYSESGELVRVIPLQAQDDGLVEYEWDGLGDDGQPMPPGNYRVEVEAVADETNVALDNLIQAEVRSVTLGQFGEEILLDVLGVGEVGFSEVRRIS